MPNPTPLTHVRQCVEAYANATRILADVEALCGKGSLGARGVQRAVDAEAVRLLAAIDALEHDLTSHRKAS